MPLVTLRPMLASDLPNLTPWLGAPHVAQWWPDEPVELAGVRATYGPALTDADSTELFVIEADGRSVGMIQRYRIDDNPQWAVSLQAVPHGDPAAGLDYLVGEPDALRQGVATAAIEALVGDAFGRWPDFDCVVVTVAQGNRASWRALEGAGFARVWAGTLDSDDASDAGPSFGYVARCPAACWESGTVVLPDR